MATSRPNSRPVALGWLAYTCGSSLGVGPETRGVSKRCARCGRNGPTVAGPNFYRESADTIKVTLARQEQLQAELEQSYARWEALEARRGSFRG